MSEHFHTRETLLQRVKSKRDEKSWEEFVHYYHQYLYLICRRMGLNHHDGEEVVQQVLIRLWEKIPEFNRDSSRRFRGWLCTVTGNAVKDFVRRRNSATKASERAAAEDALTSTVSQPEIEEMAEKEWQNFVCTLAMESVRKQFSPLVIQIFLELQAGDSRLAVSERHDLPSNTISVYKGRVVKALCSEIRRLEEELY